MSLFPWSIFARGSSAAVAATFRPHPGPVAAARERPRAPAGRPEPLRPRRVAARRSGEDSEGPPVATGPMGGLRHALRATASGPAAQREPATVAARVRPMVEAFQRELEEQLGRGAPRDAVAAARSRLADHAVVGLFHLARSWAGIGTAVAPLSVVAVGAYGESLLPPGAPPEVLLLVPEGGRERGEAERMATCLVDALRDIGFAPAHGMSTARECLAFARDEPRVLASLSSARHLAGEHGAWARLRAGIDALRWG